jgi:hypothetical protein
MTHPFSRFATRLREFIFHCERGMGLDSTHAGSDEQDFNALAHGLFSLQFEHNPPYRRFCEARGARPESVRHWNEVPAIPTGAFKEFEFSCLPIEQRTKVFYSSGTTAQQASRHFHNAESLGLYEASLWPWFAAQMTPDRQTVFAKAASERFAGQLAILTPPPAQAPNSSLVHMFETVRRKLGATQSVFLGSANDSTAWTLDFHGALDLLRRARAARDPVLMLGTAFSFVHLLDFLGEQGLAFQLPTGSRALETGGYKGRSRTLSKEDLHCLITARLGIPQMRIVCEYGMTELSSQAYDLVLGAEDQQPVTRRFQFPPWARAQIVSPETGQEVAEGETALIRVFDLANVYSVMAIQTEDLGIRRGKGFELIGRAALAELRGCSLTALEPTTIFDHDTSK